MYNNSKASSYFLRFFLMTWLWLPLNRSLEAASVFDFKARIYNIDSKTKLPYRLFIPIQYNPTNLYPLVTFLHGAGERGNDNLNQLTGQTSPLVFVTKANQTNYPCFMLAPQCPSESDFEDRALRDAIVALIQSLEAEFTIDPDRLYLTGLSMGGYGTWSLITRHPDMFAAGIPMSGGGDYFKLSRITHLPIWNFHGDADGDVSVSNSDSVIAILRAAGGSPIYTRYRNGPHGIWPTAFNTPGLVNWVMAQRRGKPSALPPRIEAIRSATGIDKATLKPTLTLTGKVLGFSSAITRLSWTNALTLSGGAISPTTNWSVDNIELRGGAVNPVMVIAEYESLLDGYTGHVTVNQTFLVRAEIPISTDLIRSNQALQIVWSGGRAPYTLQCASSLNDPDWRTLQFSGATNASISFSTTNAFCRVTGISSIPRPTTSEDFSPRLFVYTNGDTIPYRLFKPVSLNTSDDRHYPLVVFLHSYAEAGTNNESQITGQTAPLVFVSEENRLKYPCFLVAPQLPQDEYWYDVRRRPELPALIQELQNHHAIDPDRIYVTGMASGGASVWDTISRNSNLYAAAIPMSSFGRNYPLTNLLRLPIWDFHAGNDGVFGVSDTDSLISKLRNAGGRPIFTRYSFGNFAIWNTAYQTPGLVEWLMAQKRGATSSVLPFLTITAPTDQSTYTTSEATITLSGTIDNEMGAPTEITWNNLNNRRTGSAHGTNEWIAASIPLVSDGTNVIVITAKASSRSKYLGGNTTFNQSITVYTVSPP